MADHFNQLTPAEAECLAVLSEELGEAIQSIGKILRHGFESEDPTVPKAKRITNREMLSKELGDVCAGIDLIAPHIDVGLMYRQRAKKHVTIRQWLHHQPPRNVEQV